MAQVKWYGAQVQKLVKEAGLDCIETLAAEIIAEADAPIDTGFLDASAYLRSERTSTFDETLPTGRYLSRRTGEAEPRERAPSPADPPPGGAVVGWAAVYAWHVEERQSFIYPALIEVAGRHK